MRSNKKLIEDAIEDIVNEVCGISIVCSGVAGKICYICWSDVDNDKVTEDMFCEISESIFDEYHLIKAVISPKFNAYRQKDVEFETFINTFHLG